MFIWKIIKFIIKLVIGLVLFILFLIFAGKVIYDHYDKQEIQTFDMPGIIKTYEQNLKEPDGTWIGCPMPHEDKPNGYYYFQKNGSPFCSPECERHYKKAYREWSSTQDTFVELGIKTQ